MPFSSYKVFQLFSFLLLIAVSGCQSGITDLDSYEFKAIAWQSLSERERDSVVHDPEDAVVNRDVEFKDWRDEEANPVSAVSVRFNTKDDPLLGPIVVYIDPDSKEVLGQAPRL